MTLLRIFVIIFLFALPRAGADTTGPGGSIIERTRNETIYRDVVFDEAEDVPLKLDLYLPVKEPG